MEFEEVIQSPQNAKLKAVRAVRRGKDADHVLLEGHRVLADALRAGVAVSWLLFDAERRDERMQATLASAEKSGVRAVPCLPALLQEVSELNSPSGILAVAPRPTTSLAEVLGKPGLLLVIAGVQDPGNVGALVRCAAGLGASGVATFFGGASVWHPRAIRGASGTTFRLPIVDRVNPEEFFSAASTAGFSLWATATDGRRPMPLEKDQCVALLLGEEGRGLEASWLAFCEDTVGIALKNDVDSLNVATAAAVLMHQLVPAS